MSLESGGAANVIAWLPDGRVLFEFEERAGVSLTSGRFLWIRAERLPESLSALRTRLERML